MVKVFEPNKNGKIEFTKEELEALLNEVWNDGYNFYRGDWWTSPTITTQYYKSNGIEITCGLGQ